MAGRGCRNKLTNCEKKKGGNRVGSDCGATRELKLLRGKLLNQGRANQVKERPSQKKRVAPGTVPAEPKTGEKKSSKGVEVTPL